LFQCTLFSDYRNDDYRNISIALKIRLSHIGRMQTEADIIIDGLGGTSAVSEMTHTPTSTVHSWRTKGLSKSRRHHLMLAAARNGKTWPIEGECLPADQPSTGNVSNLPPAGVAA
jgi:hypothetical protein